MYRSGAFVADHVSPVDDAQVQPNGVDLRLGAVFEQREPGQIDREGKSIGDRRRIDSRTESGGTSQYVLGHGAYIVRYAETITVPPDHIGFLYPRSSLLRNSCMLDTAVWDAGYEGRGEGLLEVHHEIAIERGARIAQLVFAAADHTGTYDGSYQRENTGERN